MHDHEEELSDVPAWFTELAGVTDGEDDPCCLDVEIASGADAETKARQRQVGEIADEIGAEIISHYEVGVRSLLVTVPDSLVPLFVSRLAAAGLGGMVTSCDVGTVDQLAAFARAGVAARLFE